MNKCIFIGRLVRDPEVTFSEKAQMTISKFTIAVDRIPKRDGEPEADFINCVAFDKRAEFVEQYWFKGMRVAVSGKLQNDNYTNNKGEKVYGFIFIADDVEFADGKREPGTGENQNTAPTATGKPATASANTAPASSARRSAPAARTAPQPNTTAAPAANQGGARPAARNTPQRPASGRSAAGRPAPQRTAARTAAGSGFMNVPSGVEEGLPFN